MANGVSQDRKGTNCQRPARLKTGKCRLHGGASTGQKLKRVWQDLTSKTTHGRTSSSSAQRAKHRAEVGRKVKREIQLIEKWAVDHGHLDKNWRDKFG